MNRKLSTPLNFIHIAKCGGNTIKQLLENLFDEAEIYPLRHSFQLINGERVSPHGYGLVRGHLGIEPWWPTLPPNSTFVWLREPCDRLVSSFYFLKQRKYLAPDASLLSWLEGIDDSTGTDASLICWLLYGLMNRDPSRDTEQCRAKKRRLHERDPSLVDEACRILDRCFVVGIQEQFEQSLNLLHFHLGSLPMVTTQHANPTIIRQRLPDLSSTELDCLQEVTRLDRKVYLHGLRLFQNQHSNMLHALSMSNKPDDTSERSNDLCIRERLRRGFFKKHASDKPLQHIHHTFDRKLIGGGWQEREQTRENKPHRGFWRWIDPAMGAELYFPLSTDVPLNLFIGICHATRDSFVDALSLSVNDHSLALTRVDIRHPQLHSEYVVRTQIRKNIPSPEGLTRIYFRCDEYIVPAQEDPAKSDYRLLGLALNWIVIQPETWSDICLTLPAALKADEANSVGRDGTA